SLSRQSHVTADNTRTPCQLIRSHFSFSYCDPTTSTISTLSLHDALPISRLKVKLKRDSINFTLVEGGPVQIRLRGEKQLIRKERSEEHTSELQSRFDLVCRLLLEKKKEK